MLRNLNPAPILPSENIVRPIRLIIDVFGSHERPNPTVFIVGLQVGAVRILIVAMVE